LRRHPHKHSNSSTQKIAENRKMPTENERDKCPFLLRIMMAPDGYRYYEFHRQDETPSGKFEHRIHTWMNCTLRELADHLAFSTPVLPSSVRGTDANLKLQDEKASAWFAITYPNPKAMQGWVLREIGVVHNSGAPDQGHRTLRELQFQIGDYLLMKLYPGDPWRERRPDSRGGSWRNDSIRR